MGTWAVGGRAVGFGTEEPWVLPMKPSSIEELAVGRGVGAAPIMPSSLAIDIDIVDNVGMPTIVEVPLSTSALSMELPLIFAPGRWPSAFTSPPFASCAIDNRKRFSGVALIWSDDASEIAIRRIRAIDDAAIMYRRGFAILTELLEMWRKRHDG